MKSLSFHTADVFTTKPFTGNSLAIVLQADALSDQQMQSMAREFNLPETIFVQSPDDSANTAKVRIFTPANEIPFAGHPSIGCAIFLAEQQYSTDTDSHNPINSNDHNLAGENFTTEVKLEEVAGLVPVQVSRHSGKISAQLTAPVIPTRSTKADHQSALNLNVETAAEVLSLSVSDIDTDKSQPMAHAGGPAFLFIPLNNRSALSRIHTKEPLCSQLSHAYAATGIYVYYLDEVSNEIDARMFAPAADIPEDPATGSATAILASQLLAAKQLREGNNQFTLRQGYDMGRPSDLLLHVELERGAIVAVKVSGSSTPISSGYIRIPE